MTDMDSLTRRVSPTNSGSGSGSPGYEYAPLRLPPTVDRVTAAAQLTVAAEFSGWELAQVQLFRDGTRRVLLRRRITTPAPPAVLTC
jgi:hypothetical protein